MMERRAAIAAAMACLLGGTDGFAAEWPPAVPAGLDAYAQWDRWPYQRIGVRAYMNSTFDREGGNRTADASHFLYGERPDFNVTLDVLGRGVLYFVRTNHWHGSPWHYEVDGTDHVVRETTTAGPETPTPGSTFQPVEALPPPLAWSWSTTRGADLNWVPVPFERSLRLAYGRTFYGTGYFIHHRFAEGIGLSSRPLPFDLKTPPDPAVLDLIGRSGTDIAPVGIAAESGRAVLEPGRPLTLFRLDGPAMVRALKLTVPRDRALELSDARLRVTWDGRAEPSIDAPLALFFGAGLLYNRDDAEYLVKAFPAGIRYDGDRVHLDCYFPMPFFRGAVVELVPPGGLAAPVELTAELRHEPFRDRPSAVGYFHATYRDHGGGEPGRDHVLLDTRGIEGSRDWSGSFVGTSFTFTDRAELRTLEGDPRFFFDDAKSPQAHGTGTEEWGGGGDYWGGRTMTLPFAGHPIGAPTPAEAKEPADLVHSAYRFLLADLFPFGRNARIQLEHGGTNDMAEHYRTVTYWYGLPAASLARTDALEIGDAASERAHGYRSPEATAPRALTTRRMGVPDPGQETRTVRYTKGTSEFTLGIRPDNRGVMLRRTLDYGMPDQRAAVFVADGAAAEPVWEPAGTWYLAGSDTVYHSFPPGELDPPAPTIVTAGRRLAEDEFLLPLRLTRDRSSIRVRVAYEPVGRPLLPGMPVPESAWSEIGYEAWCWVEPEFDPGR
ncbi:DUF2961 domain-containing protein [Skermanella pratensis]|uniref:DUF2961 domain-containing protein n=1 Tax=Skermanella pratensis TaxID=2233999 RepID=UPI001301619A|nr:DUF2961 domain-containing protein [Skermanella pratensis]